MSRWWAWWDGTNLHKAVRRWDGGSWTVAVDGAADALTLVIGRDGVAFFLDEIRVGWTAGAVTATGGGCRASGFDGRLAPTNAVNATT